MYMVQPLQMTSSNLSTSSTSWNLNAFFLGVVLSGTKVRCSPYNCARRRIRETLVRSLEVLGIALHEQPNDQTKQSENGSENLNGKNLDEPGMELAAKDKPRDGRHIHCRVGSISQRSATSVDAYAYTADEVAHAHSDSGPEQRVSSEVVGAGVEQLRVGELIHLGGEDDGHDDTVNGDDFAEDDGDQVLGSYPRRLDTSTHDGHTGCPDSPLRQSDGMRAEIQARDVPCRAYDRETNA